MIETAPEILWGSITRTAKILSGTLPVIFTTLLLVDIMIRIGWLNIILKRTDPLIKKTGLPGEVSTSFIASFGSQLSGAVILEKLYSEQRINRNELLLTVQINSLPHYIKEVFTHFLPVTVPIIGFLPGMIYTCSFIFVGIFKLILIIIAGKVVLKRRRSMEEAEAAPVGTDSKKEKLSANLLKTSLRSALIHFKKMARLLIITTLLVTVADGYGFFDYLQSILAPVIAVFHIPEKMLVPAITYLGNSTAANYMVGAMYKAGSISYEIAAMTALTGSIMALPIVFLKHSVARNVSIFGTGLGLLNTSITFLIGIISRIVFLIFFLVITGN